MAKAKPKAPSKLCVRCNRLLPLEDFYPNREWRAQMYRDAWCKDCVSDYCEDAETLKEYCYHNNRKWADEFFDRAIKKASYILSTNAEYIDPTTTSSRRETIFNRTAAKQFFSQMNLANVYCYTENIKSNGAGANFSPQQTPAEDEAPALTYNK